MKLLESHLSELSKGGEPATYVEVGSGTNEAGARLLLASKDMGHYVGLDLARAFLEWSQRSYPQLNDPERCTLIHGNACHLAESMAGLVPDALWGRPRLMGLVMNTIGVLPESIRKDVVRESVLCAGTGGVVLVGCWWAGAFARGVEEFYKPNPELCGDITDEMVNLEKATLLNPKTGYSSQWWSEERVRSLFEGVVPDEDIKISTAGVGIFATVNVTELHVASAAALRSDGAAALAKFPGYKTSDMVREVAEAKVPAPSREVAAAGGGGKGMPPAEADGTDGSETEEEDEAVEASGRGKAGAKPAAHRGAEIVPALTKASGASSASSKAKVKGGGSWKEAGGSDDAYASGGDGSEVEDRVLSTAGAEAGHGM